MRGPLLSDIEQAGLEKAAVEVRLAA